MFVRVGGQSAVVRMSDTGAGGAPPPPQAPAVPPQQVTPPQQPVSQGDGRQTERELRAEAAANRVARQTAQEETERLRQQLAAAQAAADQRVQEEAAKFAPKMTKLQGTLISAELKAAAATAGLKDLDLLHLPALDRSKIVVGDDGTVTGVQEAMDAFKSAKPEYFVTAAGGQPPPAAQGGQQHPTLPQAAPVPRPAGGAVPQPASGGGAPVNVKAMTKTEYREFKSQMHNRLVGAR